MAIYEKQPDGTIIRVDGDERVLKIKRGKKMNGNTGKEYCLRTFTDDIMDNMRGIEWVIGRRGLDALEKARLIREKNFVFIKRRAMLLGGEDKARAMRTLENLQAI